MFFTDKHLLKHAGVTGRYLVANRADATSKAVSEDCGATIQACDASVRAYNERQRKRTKHHDDGRVTYHISLDALYYANANAYDNKCRARESADAAKKAAVHSHELIQPFKPFKSTSDALLSAVSIVSAPLLLTIVALDEILSFIAFTLKAIVTLAMLKPDIAKDSFMKAGHSLFESMKSLFAAAVSPVVNTVDFLGSVANVEPEKMSFGC